MAAAEWRHLTEKGAYQITGYATHSRRISGVTGVPTAERDLRGYLFTNGRFQFDPKKSYLENVETLQSYQVATAAQKAYKIRLLMELLNVRMEQKIRKSNNQKEITILERLIDCESSSWK